MHAGSCRYSHVQLHAIVLSVAIDSCKSSAPGPDQAFAMVGRLGRHASADDSRSRRMLSNVLREVRPPFRVSPLTRDLLSGFIVVAYDTVNVRSSVALHT